ncbi:arylamine N-acetyltransferase [Streptosporangium nondiastaticum]|uniref:arylamine N-acetyltransferase family protein n=1 Tax=Streptosporangium nondiastaticum TaxID=35764 RepID=UPI0031FA21EC
MSGIDIFAYLARLGLPAAPPSADALAALHAAHVERVPFETLDRPPGIDPRRSLTRIVGQGRGGVCYHLNGAFHLLLRELGYRVGMHAAGVQSGYNPNPVGANGTHNVLTVSGLPTPGNPGGRWILDVGSGEGFHRPLPLAPGTYTQGPFTYRVRPSEAAPGGWRVDYDRLESCSGVDFTLEETTTEQFAATFDRLADQEMSIFFVYGWVKRHHATGFDELIGCQLSAVGPAGRTTRTLTTAEDYLAALSQIFGLTLPHLTDEERHGIWERFHRIWTTRDFRKDMFPAGNRRHRPQGDRNRELSPQ